METNLKQYVRELPKGELHVHLNGLVPTSTVKRILLDENVTIPDDVSLTDLNATERKSSLREYLNAWQILRMIPRKLENLGLMVHDAFTALKKSNVSFVELRSTVVYLSVLLNMPLHDTLLALIALIEQHSQASQISAGLILTIPRSQYSNEHFSKLIHAYEKAGRPEQVVGIDLAGDENLSIPRDLGQLFREAKSRYGLGITIHAGETGKTENVYSAISDFDADRIGHGTAASKDERLMELLAERNICLEVCPISNALTNAVAENESHPVGKFIHHNVPFVICSDNPAIHLSSLNEDYEKFYEETNSKSHLDDMYATQIKYSFLKLSHK